MLHAVMATPFKNIEKPYNIALDIGMRILNGIAHTSLGSKIDYPLKLAPLEEFLHCAAVSKIRFHKGKPFKRCKHRKPRLFE